MITQHDTSTFEKLISKFFQEKQRQKVEICEERENKIFLIKTQWKSNIWKGDYNGDRDKHFRTIPTTMMIIFITRKSTIIVVCQAARKLILKIPNQ